MELIEKVKNCLTVIDDNNNVDENYIDTFFENDSDKEIIREKIRNFNHLISKMSTNELNNLLDKDFETEIWPLISYCNN